MRQTIMSLTFAALTLAVPTLSALPARADEIRVMTFNIWLGGDQVSMTKTLEAIRAADADVVLLQEPEGGTLKLAEALGYAYAEPRQHLLSRFPIFDASDTGGDFAYLEISPGRFIAIANVHLDWTEYGPYGARDGKTAEEVLASEQALRESGIRAYIDTLEPIAALGMPVILGGDFNSPGDDWTAAMVGSFPHIKYEIAWPAAGAMRAAGYLDSFRTAHPDALANPGITWSWGYPQPTLWDDETQDRIDLLFGRNVKVIDSQLVGGEGQPDVEIAVSPWPSDHQAVVSTFEVEGAPAPTQIYLPKRAVQQGDILAICYSFDGAPDGRLEDGWVEILDQGAASGSPHQILYSNDTTDRMALIRGATYELSPGAYDAALLDSEGTELARATFFVQAPGTRTTIATDKESYKAGETIIAKIGAAPGNRYDWLAIFPEGEADQWNYVASAYSGAIIDGEVTLDEATLGLQLDPGRYEVRFLLDDGYRAIAASPVFEVTAP